MLPALFVSHGAPTLPFDDVPARDFLRSLGDAFERPKAVLCVSAHWDTDVPVLTMAAANTTIHDFGGFPEALYRLRYDAPGAPALAERAAKLLGAAASDSTRGLDHGAWVPLMLMYPAADIPVLQLSVQSRSTPAHHMALGRALAPLREEGALILASGGYVHNLRQLDRHDMNAPEPTWSAAFGDWVHDALMERRDGDLANYRRLAPEAARAQPTEEHFMPLFVAYGAGGASTRLHKSTTFGSLRMDAYAFA
ncbi:MAG TPA: class III extradiol ring-cleavage dioxygenase [Rhizomicrobium sp.]|jgi:4,5-DOPA dioxygenase extradiol|nr:class III extradiol ring-cleavage dioxygenase [Rhizomicrobium sp.]